MIEQLHPERLPATDGAALMSHFCPSHWSIAALITWPFLRLNVS